MSKVCACGCGTKIADNKVWALGHHLRGVVGSSHPAWKGNEQPPTKSNIEQRLDRVFPPEAVVGVIGDGHIVVCQDRQYLHLLHKRRRAYRACGNARYVKCVICKLWGPPETMNFYRYRPTNSGYWRHKGNCAKYLMKKNEKKT